MSRMRDKRRWLSRLRWPSPAMVVAMLALLATTAGTTFAGHGGRHGPPGLVNAIDVQNGSLTGTDVKNSSLTGADVRNRSLTPADFRGSVRGPQGAPGTQGAQGPQGAKGDKGDPGTNATVNGVAAGGDLAGTYPNPTIANGAVTAAKLAPTPAFQDFTLENGWVKFFAVDPTQYNTPGYTKDAMGFVHLRGALGGLGRTSQVFAHLPVGFRPAGSQNTWLPVANTNADFTPRPVAIHIDNTDGSITARGGGDYNYAFLSLEGVTFFAG